MCYVVSVSLFWYCFTAVQLETIIASQPLSCRTSINFITQRCILPYENNSVHNYRIIIINPLTARVVGAPQIILQTIFSIFPVFHCPLGLAELQACPFPDDVFPPLPLSTLSSFPFHCALQDGFGQT